MANDRLMALENGDGAAYWKSLTAEWSALAPGESYENLVRELDGIAGRVHDDPVWRALAADHLRILRDKLLAPRLFALGFDAADVTLAVFIASSDLKIPAHAQSEKFASYLEKLIADETDPPQAYALIAMLLAWRCLNGEAGRAKQDFIRRLTWLRPETVIASPESLNDFGAILKGLYPDPATLFADFRDTVLNESFWQRSEELQKAALLWSTSVYWNVYGADKAFVILGPRLNEIFRQALDEERDEIAFFMHSHLVRVWLTHASEDGHFSAFNAAVEIPFSNYALRLATRLGLAPAERHEVLAGKPLRIGFVIDRAVGNSPFKVLISLLVSLSQHAQGRAEIYFYNMDMQDKAPSDPNAVTQLRRFTHKYVNVHDAMQISSQGLYYSRLEKCLHLRREIAADSLDALVLTCYDVFENFLYSTRAAPLQVYWSHGPYAYSPSGIDCRITHGSTSLKTVDILGEPHHIYHQAMLPDLYDPPVDPEIVKRARAKYPADKVVLGSISRNAKVDSETYLAAVFEIMRRCPDTVYVACGGGSYDAVQKKFADAGLAGRFYCEGWVDSHVYGHVLDLYLDTFPLNNGEARAEVRAKGLTTLILMPKNLDMAKAKEDFEPYIEKFGDAVLDRGRFLLFWLCAPTVADYIERACELVRDEALRKKAGAAVKSIVYAEEFNLKKQADSFLSFIERFVRERGQC